ncbi:hypothetical protein Sgleb_12630 [Streptomyces glebosus]|uniref:Uncharacterized protein n=1 Tax=Streptomyces glebosus TaxID=249580 RepID=A0A640SSX5_9ACTN|nr:hypothetical protein Sgleb_12630 [Streptomyces glebosus]GHG66935.1 hypothetical protein GCM10010513_36680 [Streptomyces glebosus]
MAHQRSARTERGLIARPRANPTSTLNTLDELSPYDPAADELLDRIFTDYGLVISGRSAAWDPARLNALPRCSQMAGHPPP